MLKVLVVDDHADSCDSIKALLEHNGYSAKCAPNGREALLSLMTDLPDLLVIDLLMPELDGVGLLEVLRSYLRLQRLPVIVVTGFPDGPSVQRARELGVKHVLTKGSFSAEALAAAAKNAIASV